MLLLENKSITHQSPGDGYDWEGEAAVGHGMTHGLVQQTLRQPFPASSACKERTHRRRSVFKERLAAVDKDPRCRPYVGFSSTDGRGELGTEK